MSTDNISPVQSATTVSTDRSSETTTTKAQQRAELASLAAEFESMLTVNMLRDMRTSGRWSTGGDTGGDTLGADTFDSTFDLELSRYLAKARGLGLSQQLMRAFDGMTAAADGRAADALTTSTSTTPPTATTSRVMTGTTSTAYTGRTGWNGMRLDPPAPGNSGAQWGGFNVDRALAGGDDNSIKDGFYRWTYGLAFNPAGKSKEEIGQFLRDNVTSAREYGVNILDVDGDKILVETAERGPEWVDVVAGASSPNPGDTRWQWLTQMEFGMPTGGGALGQALSSLRGLPGGQELARTVLADSRLVGDALAARLQSVAADAREANDDADQCPAQRDARSACGGGCARDGVRDSADADLAGHERVRLAAGSDQRPHAFSPRRGSARGCRRSGHERRRGSRGVQRQRRRIRHDGGGGARQRAEHALRASPLIARAPRRRDRRGPGGRPGRSVGPRHRSPCALRGPRLRPGRRPAAVIRPGRPG
jgi:Rod binding domain-containing protein